MCPKFRRTMKGLVERYRRWNPVHPTYGAFWGMGVGIGCGIGWGPGFGPEAIGYVGAGCGIGFSVGFTLAGLGVGFPVNFLFQVPYRATMATRGAALKLVGSSSLLSKKHFAGNDWTGIAPPLSELQREASERFSNFGQQHLSVKGADFFEMKNSLPSLATSACESCRALNTRLFNSHRGLDSQSTVTGTSSATMQHTFCKEPPSASKNQLWQANGLTRSAALSSVDNPKYATWEAENSLVQSWFTDALTREIGKNLLLYKIAHDVWTGERTSFFFSNNKAILFDTECFLHDFRQGNLDVTQYYNVLVRHWQLLDLYEIHQWYCETDAQHFNTLKEERECINS
ncbi:uncharacterized protein LOC114714153 [Neltuma alba]|uniref:uncharacterized protein LOC114714153 n=1 Tax=Neltuma alba TaxID=207710 RepID=UPI0010A4948E|nr:uncharacterized protein LOC114714153 [Prosopis alba]